MEVRFPPRSARVEREGLAAGAQQVLRQNDMGGWTRAASNLYPHQWSWDTGFIAIGLAHLDTRRAGRELLTLFQHQWKTGKVPHIVFNPEAPPESYFPGATSLAPSTGPAPRPLPTLRPRRPTPAACASRQPMP
jgi:glucosylglycerate hydrolase